MHWMLVAAAFLAATVSARAETCDQQVFEHCQACHALTTDAGQKPGPQLAGVIGRPVAGDPAFDYSPVLQEARAKGEVWTKDKLDLYLSDPQAVYAGTWMGSPPIRDAKQRADILCVLEGRYAKTPASPAKLGRWRRHTATEGS
jgi:cytochrome c